MRLSEEVHELTVVVETLLWLPERLNFQLRIPSIYSNKYA